MAGDAFCGHCGNTTKAKPNTAQPSPAGVAPPLTPKGGSLKSHSLIGIGVVLIIVAVLAVVAAQPMYQKAGEIYMFESMNLGTAMANQANVIHYGGIALGVAGAVVLLVGLLRQSQSGQPGRTGS